MEIAPIHEYESFTRGEVNYGGSYHPLPAAVFDKLEQFIVENKAAAETDALELMGVSYRRGIGKIITAKNYVGLLAMQDGTVIEVLPKISGSAKYDPKKLLVEMLKTVKELPFKSFNTTNLDVAKLPLLDIFISMFINEVKLLLQKGLKSDYVLHQDNEKFLKGKLLFNRHLKANLAHKERFFVEYHTYSLDRVENRLLKTTLQYLLRFARLAKNKRELRMLLDTFDEVQLSHNVAADFSQCSKDRDMRAYEQVLRWCRIFLQGNGFTNYKGSHLATALLFPMEKLFESYVAEKLSKALDADRFEVRTQDSRHHLFARKFQMRPDIVVESRQADSCVVLDTKWKLLNPNKNNNDISQGDMYQMYAYGKKYATERVVLLYPLNELVENLQQPIDYPASANDDVSVAVRFLDLSQKDFLDAVIAEFFN